MGGRRLVGIRKWKGRKEEHPRLEPAMAQGQGGGELCDACVPSVKHFCEDKDEREIVIFLRILCTVKKR